ncbi:hypothetical protein PR002_g2527 [Phytophthora rubi]|uniref:GPI ethanolamine phosphate transferase 2 C-terminal domain-containing protein n=1 Tax=Phytophthora rubi TaxID=129364 RepID=A0A6A3NKB9_9STRA|nr:hypothetical protein PR002_g2527 [Phytophthora rubi]
MTPTLVLRLLCLCAGLGAYLCSSGLLRLNEVFFQPSAASPSDWNGQNPQRDNAHQTDAAYDRLVVVLIDALRADMVLGSAAMHGTTEGNEQQTKGELNAHMPFTSGLVTSGRALGYVAHASVPTVTMPRLKALVTGKAPAFIDILKNFNSAALDEDANLVSLLAASGKRIVFYGDDTWLKLFPETFKRSDGTSGFYTRDTVEVDDNVTRHLKEELDPTMQEEKSGDWDALVLHYLGLDHVGHLRGPRSPLMREKLEEMDDVVRLVVDSVRAQDAWRMEKDKAARPSLVLLCSDHGMSEVGNHGGATLEESSALLMFMRGDGKPMRSLDDISYKQKRSQVDLVPTISSLFGLSIPIYSSGLLLEDVVRASSGFALHPETYYLRALYRNFQQLYALANIKFHASALVTFDKQYEIPLSKLSKVLEGDEHGISVDKQTAAAVLEACETLQAKVAQSDGSEYNSTAIFSGLVFIFFSGVATLAMLIITVKMEADDKVVQQGSHLHAVLGVGSILQIASLSSMLRKAVHEIVSAQRKGELLAFFVGVCSGFLFLVGMTANLRVKELSDQNIVEDGSQALAGWISLDADASARVVYASVVLLTVLTSLAGRNLRLSLMEMIIWLLVGLLQRDANFPTLSLLCLQMESVARLLRCEQAAALRQDGVIVAGLALWLSQAAFFALGNSHLVSTIDISQSYHGLSAYSQSLVGALTFVSVFSGPLVCFVNLFQWLDATTSVKASSTLSGRETQGLTGSTNATKAACLTIFTYQALRFAVYTVVVYFMRFHLFIWSVFAPKMLYEVAHLAVSLVLVALLAPATSNSERELNGPTKPRHMDYESTTTTSSNENK